MTLRSHRRPIDGMRGDTRPGPPRQFREEQPEGERREVVSMTELNEQLRDAYDSQPLIVRCGLPDCEFVFEGTAREARDVAASHRSRAHGDLSVGRALLDAMDAGESVAANGSGPVVPPRLGTTSERARPEAAAESSASGGARVPLTKHWTRERTIDAIKAWARDHDGMPPTASMWIKKEGDGRPTTSVVQKLFGGWAAAIEAAGFERPVRGRHPRKPAAAAEPESSGFPSSDEEPEPEPLERESHEWAHELRRAILDDPVTITVDEPLPEHGMRLMETLGVNVVVRERAPEPVPVPTPVALAKVDETLTMPSLNVLEDPERSQPFVAKCEELAERYETAAIALRQIISGVRTLEGLNS